MAGFRAVTGMEGKLKDLYAEDETEVTKLRQAQQADDEMATSAGRWRAAQRLFGGRPEGKDPKISTATERLLEERTLRADLGKKRKQDMETSGLEAYLQRQGMSPEDAAVTARSKVAQDAWRTGQERAARREDAAAEREWREAQAREERDWRAGESEKNRRARLAAARATQREKKEPDLSKAATDLRKEFTGHPVVKRYQDIRISMDKVRRAAERANTSKSDGERAASDLSLVFGFMKMLDPGSVVREGEFATAQNAAGVPDRVRNAYNRALSGEILNPNQRAGFLAAAEDAYRAETATYQPIADLYGRLAQTQGLDPADIIAGRAPAPRPTQGGNVDLTAPTGSVRMKAPDGMLYEVDPSEAEEALANGWEPL